MPSFTETSLPVAAALAVALVAGLIYVMLVSRQRRSGFSVLDALILVAIMSLVTGTAIPGFQALSEELKSNVLHENLRIIRTQIDLYRIEHFDQPPILFRGAFPQLENRTNRRGEPGTPPKHYPLGAYLPDGVPVNPFTGRNVVTPIEQFPPQEPSGKGGWLYHQATGQIAADHESYLQD